jgi:UDP-N-acetyl-D-galactosamine dehydrogenase
VTRTLPAPTADFAARDIIAVIGLGYVGLPLAVAFACQRPVIGFDIDPARIRSLQSGHDRTREVSASEFTRATHLVLTDDPAMLKSATIFIITVPTPVDGAKRPDLSPLLLASETVGAALKPGDLVIYESTVYPGATEEDCVPVLERRSGLIFNRDFFCGYSPERMNPGDMTRRLQDIVKITSGSTPNIAAKVDELYAAIIPAGTYKVESIRVAEAAKVVENIQRDVNIALVNELAVLFNLMHIDTGAVLKAAGTKWNFLPFRPGLVGGHCISVDPYYLTHKAESLGYTPQMILAGRKMNDAMGAYVAGQLVNALRERNISLAEASVLVLGLAFKENCPDLRNTRVMDMISELRKFNLRVDVHDPVVEPTEALAEHGIELTETPQSGVYDGIVIAVAHDVFRSSGAAALRKYGRDRHILYDLKHIFDRQDSDLRL